MADDGNDDEKLKKDREDKTLSKLKRHGPRNTPRNTHVGVQRSVSGIIILHDRLKRDTIGEG